MTLSKAPKLSTLDRATNNEKPRLMSTEEREIMEIKQAGQFKAIKLNKKIFHKKAPERVSLGLATKPKEFNFTEVKSRP